MNFPRASMACAIAFLRARANSLAATCLVDSIYIYFFLLHGARCENKSASAEADIT